MTSAPSARSVIDRDTGEISETLPLLQSSISAEVDQQIATAKRYPRNLVKVLDKCRSMALHSEDIAASCIYSVPKGGKPMKGPSVRLAEIFASSWGNIRVEARPGALVGDFVTAEAAAWDLESNTAIRVEVSRRAVDKNGKRYSTDVLQSTMNAAKSIAFRDAVFRVIPKVYIHEVYDAAEQLAVGNIQSLADRRGKAIEFLARYGITADRVCSSLGRQSIEQLTLEDVATLKAMIEDIRRGEKTIDECFPDPAAEPKTTGAAHVADAAAEQLEKMEADRVAREGAKSATPEDIARRDAILRQANGCTPGQKGCSTDASADGLGKLRCANHADEAQSAPMARADTPNGGAAAGEPAAGGNLPGMEPAASNRPQKRGGK